MKKFAYNDFFATYFNERLLFAEVMRKVVFAKRITLSEIRKLKGVLNMKKITIK